MSDEFLTDPGKDADGSALRKFAEAQKAKAETLEKQLNELLTEKTERSRKDVFEQLKVPEGIRKFYSGDVTADAVKAWIEENKTVFNFGDVSTTSEGANPDTSADNIPDEVRQQVEQLQQTQNLGRDNGGAVGLDAKLAKLKTAVTGSTRVSEADLEALLGEILPD